MHVLGLWNETGTSKNHQKTTHSSNVPLFHFLVCRQFFFLPILELNLFKRELSSRDLSGPGLVECVHHPTPQPPPIIISRNIQVKSDTASALLWVTWELFTLISNCPSYFSESLFAPEGGGRYTTTGHGDRSRAIRAKSLRINT